jgi:hypothetical protein
VVCACASRCLERFHVHVATEGDDRDLRSVWPHLTARNGVHPVAWSPKVNQGKVWKFSIDRCDELLRRLDNYRPPALTLDRIVQARNEKKVYLQTNHCRTKESQFGLRRLCHDEIDLRKE